MTDWTRLEQLYSSGLDREPFREFSQSMLNALQHLKSHLDTQKYVVGSAMYKLAVWANKDPSRVVQIHWTAEKGFAVSIDRFESHIHEISLDSIIENIDHLLQ